MKKKKMTPTETIVFRTLKIADIISKINLGGQTLNFLRRSKDNGVPLYRWARSEVCINTRRRIINVIFTKLRYFVKGLCK